MLAALHACQRKPIASCVSTDAYDLAVQAIELSVQFPSVPFKANAHWFFVPQVDASPGNEFLWLSAAKPITAVSFVLAGHV